MKIVKIEWQNIFSYGNKIQTLNFGDTGKLWQLSGRSGSGKSSLLTMPKLLLFGKTEGSDGKNVKTAAINNRINGHGWIRGTILHGKNTFVIERTFSPSKLTIYKNGENLDKAGVKNMQEVIDNEIIDNMPYTIFSNVMTLSLNNFKSFISMTPNDKRIIIDRIFSLEIFNKVSELIRRDMTDLGNVINANNSQIFALNQTIKRSSDELFKLTELSKNDNAEEISMLKERAAKANELYNSVMQTYQKSYEDYTNICNSENQLNGLKQQHLNNVRTLQKQIQLFKADKCPTCGTPFDGEAFVELKEKLDKDLLNEQTILADIDDKAKALLETKNGVIGALNTIKEQLNKIQQKQSEIAIEVKGIETAASKSTEFQSIQKIISETDEAKRTLEANIEKFNRKMVLMDTMKSLYSPEGIKKQMMENYIPTLNEEIKNTLISLSFPYMLEFDNAFDPHLECLGEPIEIQSLSTGEHKKVDLAVLCAILRMLKRKYPQINLVCLDETLSSLDYESSTDIITYLAEIANTMCLNIFIVSHTQLDENLFDVRIHIDKNSGFSDLTYV